MMADGRAALFAPSGLKDGPLPTHYEPVESPGRATRCTRQASTTRPPSTGSGRTTGCTRVATRASPMRSPPTA